MTEKNIENIASMNAMEKLRAACGTKNYQSFNDLAVGDYIVHEFAWVDTSHGRRIRISLENHYMYLPDRFESLSDADIAELNATLKVMVYGGKDSKKKNRLILDFHEVEYLAAQLFEKK